MPVQGHCNCKSIKVTLPALPKQSGLCYCANCKRSGSSAFSIVHFLPTSDVSIQDPHGVLKSYVDKNTRSGNVIVRQFCGECGSPIATVPSPNSDILIVKGGLFDEIPSVGEEYFTDCKPEWLHTATPSTTTTTTP